MEVKRELTLKECKHILRYCLSLPLLHKNIFACEEDYNVYIKELKRDINLWIRCTYNYNIIVAKYAPNISEYSNLELSQFVDLFDYLKKIKVI